MEIKEIIELIEAVSKNGLTSFVLEENGSKIAIKKEKEKELVPVMSAAPAVSQVLSAPVMAAPLNVPGVSGAADSAPAGEIASDKVVMSPLVGTFYNSSSPEADPFVKVGDSVKKGQVLGIIEAMKLMNEIESDYDGVVEAILVENEDIVEYGQPLFRIK